MILFLTKNLYFTNNKKILHLILFYCHFVLSHASLNTTSTNIRGTDAWAVPHLKFFGEPSPSSPKSPPMALILIIGRGVQYVYCMMHKCIMVKIGGEIKKRK